MKKNIKITAALIIGFIILQSCASDEDSSLVNKLNATVTSGATLRTVKINQETFNFTNLASEWSITAEVQEVSNGDNFQEIKLYALKETNGVKGSEKFLKSILSSNFTTGPNGYPRGIIKATLSETILALGLTSGQYLASDKLIIRCEIILKDGRTFSSNDAAPTVTNGSYYSSPYSYSVQFACPLTDASIFNGNFKVVVDAWADYTVGATIPLLYSATNGTFKFRILNSNNTSCLPISQNQYIEVTVNPLTNVATATTSAPYDYGAANGGAFGATGTGTVGSCTGDVNLKMNWSGPGGAATNQTFKLVKL